MESLKIEKGWVVYHPGKKKIRQVKKVSKKGDKLCLELPLGTSADVWYTPKRIFKAGYKFLEPTTENILWLAEEMKK